MRERRCIASRNCQDGDDNNSISIGIPLFTCLEARSKTFLPSKAQTTDRPQAYQHGEDAEWHIKAQTVQKSQWYVKQTGSHLILGLIRADGVLLDRMYNV
jgi:hypothetical protein